MPRSTGRLVYSSYPLRHARFLRWVMRQQHINSPALAPIILQYISAEGNLRAWFWYVACRSVYCSFVNDLPIFKACQ